jgi:hypothetical protein
VSEGAKRDERNGLLSNDGELRRPSAVRPDAQIYRQRAIGRRQARKWRRSEGAEVEAARGGREAGEVATYSDLSFAAGVAAFRRLSAVYHRESGREVQRETGEQEVSWSSVEVLAARRERLRERCGQAHVTSESKTV